MAKKTSLQLKIEDIETCICELQSDIHSIETQIKTYADVLKMLREKPEKKQNEKHKTMIHESEEAKRMVKEGGKQ